MFPNPQYGSWESAVLQGRNASTPVERWQGKVDSMRVWSGPAASP
jgi:predicted secreted acid phosphatase